MHGHETSETREGKGGSSDGKNVSGRDGDLHKEIKTLRNG